MLGLDKGLLGTLIGGSVLAAVVYVALQYSSQIFEITGSKTGLAHNFQNVSKVYQGA